MFECLEKNDYVVNAVVDKVVGKDCRGTKTVSLKDISSDTKSVCIISPNLPFVEMEEVKKELSKHFNNVLEMKALEWMIYRSPILDEYMNYSQARPFNHYESPFCNRMEYDWALKWKNIPPQNVNLNVKHQKGFMKIIGKYAHDYHNKYNEKNFRWKHNTMFEDGDAMVYHAMIRHYNPKRIIEIGSGFSTAVVLDTLEFWNCSSKITCIEPYPNRLYSIMKEDDKEKLNIVDDFVQNVSLDKFKELDENDILFIDSSHVLKSGGDVIMEYLQIIPCLKSGVIIHVHDILYPFQYGAGWIASGRPYTEAFLLHALLMDNPNYEILFWEDYIGKFCREEYEKCRGVIPDVGGSFWMRKK